MAQILDLLKPNLMTWLPAAFVTLLGFYVTNVVEDLRSGYTAIYYFSKDNVDNSVTFHLINASHKKRIDQAKFLIKCKDQSENCFKPDPRLSNSVAFSHQLTTPPNFGRTFEDASSGPAAIQACLGAIASSRTSIKFFPSGGIDVDFIALYDPWDPECSPKESEATNLLLLDPSDMNAILVQHYISIVTGVLLASILGLFIVGIIAVWQALKGKKEVTDEELNTRGQGFLVIGYSHDAPGHSNSTEP